ncbi:unnamed protein product [Chironomus riparius]|uniref:C2H2-type domain-containing protein n=1 Tax=Chironomus riparius TaxID=315576 RepID=A0A9N9RNG5_9DIPT|nr:unnamed protein product [Chironomus riparius]
MDLLELPIAILQEDGVYNDLSQQNGENSAAEMSQQKNNFIYDKGFFFCGHCGVRFSTKEEVMQHMTIHTVQDLKRMDCKFCEEEFISEGAYTQHLKTAHSNGPAFPCKKCRVILSSSKKLRDHMIFNHYSGKLFVCKICKAHYKDKKDFIQHENSVHFNLPYECDFDGKKYARKPNLINHMITSHMIDFELFKCEECPYTSKLKYLINIHKKTRHSKIAFACSYAGCSFVTANKLYLSQHRSKVHDKKTFE